MNKRQRKKKGGLLAQLLGRRSKKIPKWRRRYILNKLKAKSEGVWFSEDLGRIVRHRAQRRVRFREFTKLDESTGTFTTATRDFTVEDHRNVLKEMESFTFPKVEEG